MFAKAKHGITVAMNRKAAMTAVAIAALAGTLAGCARFQPSVSSEPYIFQSGEFDRARSDYGQEPKTVSEVRVCYRRDKTTPAQIGEMAREECGRFGKTAVFIGNEYLNCPLLNPAEAYYRCLGPGERLSQEDEERVARMKARL